MNRFMQLLKNGRIGKICKFAALGIALIGAVEAIMQLYATWIIYQSLQAQPEQYGPNSSIAYFSYLLPNFTSALQNLATTIFYVVVLYIAGVLINAFFGSPQDEKVLSDNDDTAITYEPLDDEVIIESIDKRH